MADEILDPGANAPDPHQGGAVLATTDQPVPLVVHEIEDERVPDGMRCLGTYLDGTLVARCAVPPGAADFFAKHGVFGEPRQLVLAAREETPGLRCELYAIIPMPKPSLEDLDDDEDSEPWSKSVPRWSADGSASDFERDESDSTKEPVMAAVLLGQIVRFEKDRKHPESLPRETVDVLARIVSGRVVEVIDKVLSDLLGS